MSARDVIDALTRVPPPSGISRNDWDSLVSRLLHAVRSIERHDPNYEVSLMEVWDCSRQLSDVLNWYFPPELLLIKFRRYRFEDMSDTQFNDFVVSYADKWAEESRS